jgi:hypothetical protein
MAHTSHNDEAVLDCLLGRDTFRARIREQILNAQPPKAIAIHGTWGTGKTSMLKQLCRELGGEYGLPAIKQEEDQAFAGRGDVKAVWFEAWQYQHEPNILLVLLKAIRDQLLPKEGLSNKAGKLSKAAILGLIRSIDISFEAFGASFGVNGLSKNIQEEITNQKTKNFELPLAGLRLKEVLQEAIHQLLEIEKIADTGNLEVRRNKKVVIFIDDLDRCEYETIYSILESIKVYLNLENCVFVLGMDMQAVEESIAHKYDKSFSVLKGKEYHAYKSKARLYLEKICQDVFILPIIPQDIRKAYFKQLIGLQDDNFFKDFIESVDTLCTEYHFLPPFPRSIKIFANVIISHLNYEKVRVYLEANSETNHHLRFFIILSYLYAFHFELYQLVYMYSGSENMFYNEQLRRYCELIPLEAQSNLSDPKNTDRLIEPTDFDGRHALIRNLVMPETILPRETGNPEKARELAFTYPHEHLRQVFWIQKLVAETNEIIPYDLKTLKF